MFAAGLHQIGRALEPERRNGGRPAVGRRVRRRDRTRSARTIRF